MKWLLTGGLCLLAAVLLLRAVMGGEDVEALAASASAKDRLRAATVLAERGGGELLVRLANDEDRTVALQAVHGMSRQGDASSHQALAALLTDARDPAVRAEAAAALGRFGQTEPSQLAALLEPGGESRVRIGAARGLARLGPHRPRETAPIFVRGLRDADPHVRVWSITGIYNITGRQFPKYDASRPAESQREVIAFIESKLREQGLLR